MNALILPSAALALNILDKLEIEIANAPTFAALDKIANQSAGMQRTFKPVKEVADRAGAIWIKAEKRLGSELRTQPKDKGGRPSKTSLKVSEVSSTEEKGVERNRATRAQKLDELSDEKTAEIIERLKSEGKGVTPNAVLAKSRQEAKQEKKHAVKAAVFSADGPFDVVVIDPPWKMEKIDRDVRPNQDAFDYPTMSYEEIEAFCRETLAPKLADDCHLFMWTTQKYLPDALELVRLVGFRYVLTMVWHKAGGFQPIDLPQYNCEFIIYARQGSPLFVDTKQFNCCFEAPRREHSRKPDFFYDTVRRVTGGSRIDVFSREPREGFAQFGNEIGRFAA
jgi:N6-adenosine-specific RNA methylase IME4